MDPPVPVGVVLIVEFAVGVEVGASEGGGYGGKVGEGVGVGVAGGGVGVGKTILVFASSVLSLTVIVPAST